MLPLHQEAEVLVGGWYRYLLPAVWRVVLIDVVAIDIKQVDRITEPGRLVPHNEDAAPASPTKTGSWVLEIESLSQIKF